MRWGVIPVGRVNARGRPVLETLVNIRSETMDDKSAFEGMKRAVVPVDGWYEWTGTARRKVAWRVRAKDNAALFFAALCDLWRGPGGIELLQVATITCPPNADVEPIHHRMGMLLRPADLGPWLAGPSSLARALARPWPAGLLHIERADDVDWHGP